MFFFNHLKWFKFYSFVENAFFVHYFSFLSSVIIHSRNSAIEQLAMENVLAKENREMAKGLQVALALNPKYRNIGMYFVSLINIL